MRVWVDWVLALLDEDPPQNLLVNLQVAMDLWQGRWPREKVHLPHLSLYKIQTQVRSCRQSRPTVSCCRRNDKDRADIATYLSVFAASFPDRVSQVSVAERLDVGHNTRVAKDSIASSPYDSCQGLLGDLGSGQAKQLVHWHCSSSLRPRLQGGKDAPMLLLAPASC